MGWRILKVTSLQKYLEKNNTNPIHCFQNTSLNVRKTDRKILGLSYRTNLLLLTSTRVRAPRNLPFIRSSANLGLRGRTETGGRRTPTLGAARRTWGAACALRSSSCSRSRARVRRVVPSWMLLGTEQQKDAGGPRLRPADARLLSSGCHREHLPHPSASRGQRAVPTERHALAADSLGWKLWDLQTRSFRMPVGKVASRTRLSGCNRTGTHPLGYYSRERACCCWTVTHYL